MIIIKTSKSFLDVFTQRGNLLLYKKNPRKRLRIDDICLRRQRRTDRETLSPIVFNIVCLFGPKSVKTLKNAIA